MKKIILYIFAYIIMLSFHACNSFLEESPKSQIVKDTYYSTPAQALANVNFLYRVGAQGRMSNAGSAYVGPNASVDGMLTGYFINSYEGQELACRYARLLTRSTSLSTLSNLLNDIWDNCYLAINVSNSAIKYIPDIPGIDETYADRLVAEAKFFRAFNYYYLVKTFGDVPMYEEPYESYTDNLLLGRTPVADIYALMEADLTVAVNTLPEVMFAMNEHRISKYIAAMTLANVYLRQEKYSEAADAARIVTGSPHRLETNDDLALGSAYNKLRSIDDLDEVIYAQEYDESISSGGWWPTYAFSSGAVSVFGTYSIFERVYGPIDRFLNVYEADDLRIQPNQFFHWTYTNPNNGRTWSSESAGCWYYYDENALLNSGRATKDWNFFRYAEALLVAAEAIAASPEGVTSEAAGYLAEIKARADMNGKTIAQYSTELQTLSNDDFIKECWTERLREFPLEFKIWDDCSRTGMFPVISETTQGEVTYVPLVGATNGAGAVFSSSDLFWPLSIDELQRNPNLEQNEGYPTQ
ncbi:MAG: RagB/SusD family nutrient uptake outer membrane protein [Prevotella sp.]|jgi:hypothetical protein|nr:RagB/SusD family nutrient uptake outer membrane protein [Prevotella sp.]